MDKTASQNVNPEFPIEQELFTAALQRTSEERAAFLDGACHGVPHLRQRLEALLAAHEIPATELADFGEVPSRVHHTRQGTSEEVGQRLGRFKLLEKLGEGGCGVVYVAEQTEPVRRRVALKVIKLGMDTRAVVARFDAERQALALMDHPNIARVLDAGATDGGRPFFVMELVRGVRITDYCDRNHLTTHQRLDLFIKVCHAVQHAHQKGIIHRDIKPSNILVTLHDGVPVPKVIDFGIAKATEGRLTDATVYTQLHQLIGTPAYMSPEQAEMSGLDIDTRSDIYSLGVLLYELLTGLTPFNANELMAQGLDTLRRTIRETEPMRPSTRVAALPGETLTTAAKCRSVEVGKLTHQLRGDLDWIVMKCLEKDRTRRYETANGLAADLRRHLANEPVIARPPSAAYKLRKAIRRNRLVYGATFAVFVALALGLGFSLSLYWKSARLVRELQAERVDRYFDEAMAAALSSDSGRMMAAVKKAESVGVQNYKILMIKGWHASLAGRSKDAIESLKTALALKPDSVAVLSLLAGAQNQLQQWTEYDHAMDRMHRMQPTTAEDYLFKGSMIAVDDPDTGVLLLDEAIRRKPSPAAFLMRAEARAGVAQYHLSIKWATEAMADLQVAKSLVPESLGLAMSEAMVYSTGAMLEELVGNKERVESLVRLCELSLARLAQFNQTAVAVNARAIALETLGRETEAFELLEQAVVQNGHRESVLVGRYATGLCVRGRLDEAVRVIAPIYPADSYTDSIQALALLFTPGKRAQFEQVVSDYFKRYDGIGDQLYGLFLPRLAGMREFALGRGREFHRNPPAGFEFRRVEYHRASKYFAGLMTDEEYLEASRGTVGEFWDSHFQVGVMRFSEGRRSEAMAHLKRVVHARTPFAYTYEFARVLLAVLERQPEWPN